MNEDTPLVTVEKGRDAATGQFVAGCPAGPGRPLNSVGFVEFCRRRAKESKTSLDEMMWAAFRGTALRAAKKGDGASCKIVLDRAYGPQEKAPVVQVGVGVEVNANDREVVLPLRRALATQLLEMRETAMEILGIEDELDELLG